MRFLTGPVVPAGTLARIPQPALPTGDGLLLRPWRAQDAPAVYAAFQDPLMRQWHIRAADSKEEVAGWIAQWRRRWQDERQAQWAVVDADNELLGRVALRDHDPDPVGDLAVPVRQPLQEGRRAGRLRHHHLPL